MNSGATTERVYQALKRELLSSAIPPGVRLDPGYFAEVLSSSVTPVRDALNQLTGEGLVEARPSEGFFQPHLHEPALRDLYAWNAQLLRLMVGAWPREGEPDLRTRDLLPVTSHVGFARAIFASVAAPSDNAEHHRQIDAASDRLSVARHAEEDVLPGLADEAIALAEAIDRNAKRPALKAIAVYHRRRDRAVASIVRAIYRPR